MEDTALIPNVDDRHRFPRSLTCILFSVLCLLPAFPEPIAASTQAVDASDCTRAPRTLADGFPTAPPASLGLDADGVCRLIQAIRVGHTNVHSVLVLRQGKLVAEVYRQGMDRTIFSLWSRQTKFDVDTLHDMRSASKSVISLLYGILLDRGEVPPLDTSVVSLYPEYAGDIEPEKRKITVRHLLTMTSGLEWNEPSPVHRATSTDEVGLFLSPCAFSYVFGRKMIAPAGKRFVYSGGSTEVLAEIMQRATGRSLRDIARQELFQPLGITDWQWQGSPFGQPFAAAGLRLTSRELMKIGVLVLNDGMWRGKRVVSEEWIKQSTETATATPPVGGYGLHWWTRRLPQGDRPVAATVAIGNGGQRLYLIRELDLAVVITAGYYNDQTVDERLDPLIGRIIDIVRR